MKAFDHYCEYRRTPNGLVLAPVQLGRWLVIFCDEINLPKPDKYGTQRVISFLRQLVSQVSFLNCSNKYNYCFFRMVSIDQAISNGLHWNAFSLLELRTLQMIQEDIILQASNLNNFV